MSDSLDASDRRPTSIRSMLCCAVALLAVAATLASCAGDDNGTGDAAATSEALDTAPSAAPDTAAATRDDDSATESSTTEGAADVPDDSDELARSEIDRGGTLTFGVLDAPPSLNPAIGDPAFNAVYQWAYDPLIILQPDGTYAPNLATEFGYAGDRNMRYEMTLREGVKFSDGAELDAEAVKTHLDYVRSQPTSLAQLLGKVVDIEITGPLSLAIDLSAPDPGLDFAFAQGFGAGFVISPASVASPETLDLGTAGAGPYMLVSGDSVPADTYSFVPNPHYWNPARIHWDEVVVRVIPNSSSMLEAIRAGQIQAGQGDPTTMVAAREAGITVTAAPLLMVGLNLMDRGGVVSAPLGDVRVRRALNHAVDREAVAAALLGDAALALSQYALGGHKAHDPALDALNAYDPNRARRLLAEAGYGDGVTIGVIDVSLLSLDTMVQAVSGQLAEVGVTLDITTGADVTGYFTGMISGEYPIAALAYGLRNMQTLRDFYIAPTGPFNPFGTVDPELDALYEEYFTTMGDTSDVEQRINARLVDQAWALPVMGSPLVWYLADGLGGIESTTGNAAIPSLVDIRPE